MPDYTKAKIYKLTSTKDDREYIGSTTLTLKKRLSCHRANYNSWKKGKAEYKTSFDIIKKDPYAIKLTLLEEVPCQNHSELKVRERALISKCPKCLNHNLNVEK